MPIYCDECEAQIASLGEAHENEVGEVLCDICIFGEDFEDEEDDAEFEAKGPVSECDKCGRMRRERDLIEKLEGRKLCDVCAHVYELKLFTPPDHDAEQCALCQRTSIKGKAA